MYKRQISSYQLIDAKENTGVAYYRIAQYDIDGTRMNSEIIKLVNSTQSCSISPNPFSSQISLTYSGDENSSISIFDNLGRIVEQLQMPEESYSIMLGEKLAKGIYTLRVVSTNETKSFRLVKE